MPQSERDDERRAREIVQREYGIELEFVDLHGGVDHQTEDGHVVLEVTRFTDEASRQGREIAKASDQVVELGTGNDWYVTFAGYPRYAGLASRLYPALQSLETHGLTQYDPSR